MPIDFTRTSENKGSSSDGEGVSNIILVHGAWADGSSWSKVIPLLRLRGLKVTAVQLPLRFWRKATK
jgi:pimeloyl-ACP methyl ester carboxylesterase